MGERNTGRVLAAVMVLAAAPVGVAGASTLPGFGGLTIFGDSLSDPGNAAALAAGLGLPFPPEFPLGKASDGALWSETVLQSFVDAGLPARNFAFAAGRIRAPLDPTPGNLTFQIGVFDAQTPLPVGADEAALFWLGANDIRDALGAAAQGVAMGTLDDPEAFLEDAAEAAVAALITQAQGVAAAGFGSLVFVNLPDLSRIPATLAQGAAAQAAAQLATGAFNAALAREVSTLELAGVHSTVFDLNAAFLRTLDAGLPGVSAPVTDTCLDAILGPSQTVPDIADLGQCASFFFYDDIHPTSALHAALAAEIGAVVRPAAQPGVIPLPASGWLLLGGLAGLGVLARRRRG